MSDVTAPSSESANLALTQSSSPEATTDPLAGLDQRKKVRYIAEKVLEARKADSNDKAVSGTEIFAEAMKLFPDAGVPENTFKQYLSRAVRDSGSQINCLGKKQGYYLSAAAKSLERNPDEPVAETAGTLDEGRREKEKLLYPVLMNWQIEQGYRSKITAAARANGQWGNPDITGIACDESFGSLWLEVTTVEVKLSDKDWKKWIFEAISHRRFANRSYFAFAYPAELIKKLDPELRYFSELYQIGVIVVAMEQERFDDLQSGKLTVAIEDEEVDIVELYSAPYTAVQTRFQREYLESLKIKSTPDVARWGEGLEGNE